METITLEISSSDELSSSIAKYKNQSSFYDVTVSYYMTQEEIEMLASSEIGQNATNLSISPRDYCDNSPEIDYSLVTFPLLLELSVHYQKIKAIHITKDNTPKLKHLSIEQVAEEVEYFLTDLPDLETIVLQFVDLSDPRGFGKSLSRSPKLNSVNCYKLWGLSGTKSSLVLPSCEHLKFYRSDDLGYLKIWAPKLERLNLQACYSIKEVTILDSIPQGYKAKGKEYNFEGKLSDYKVNFINTSVPRGNITTHARCIKVVKDLEDKEDENGFF